MTPYRCISPQQLHSMLQNGALSIVDIRDIQSFSQKHIPNAQHLDNQSLPAFVGGTPKDQAIVVVCYHGHSSQSAAAYLVSLGYSEVCSLDGCFELWHSLYPELTVAKVT